MCIIFHICIYHYISLYIIASRYICKSFLFTVAAQKARGGTSSAAFLAAFEDLVATIPLVFEDLAVRHYAATQPLHKATRPLRPQ